MQLATIFLLFGGSIVVFYELYKLFFTSLYEDIIIDFKKGKKELQSPIIIFFLYYILFMIFGLILKFNWFVLIYIIICVLNDINNREKDTLFKIDAILTILILIYWIIL